MLWLLLALTAHLGNAVVFVIDKSLLAGKSTIAEPWRYAFYSAVLAGAAIVILPWVYVPLTPFILMWSVLTGAAHIMALWLFFSALRGGEPSRIVPIAGSAVPVFTLVIAVTVLGEVLAAKQWGGVALLIIGGALLSISFGRAKKIPGSILLITLLAGLFFAAYFAGAKYLYDHSSPFLAVFVYGRFFESLLALLVLGPLVWLKRERRLPRDRLTILRGPKKKRSWVAGRSILPPAFFVSNKVLAAGAFLLQSYAISLGSVTVVNALQGTQYLFVLLLAAAVSQFLPNLFKEELHRVALTQKLAGIAAVAVGLVLLV